MSLRYDQGMTTHHEPIDHPLTEAAAVELTMKFASSVVFQMVASVVPDDLTEYARAAFDAGREQGWDDAAQHIYNKGWEGVTALRKANPHRPALSLPTDAFATNPPADADRPWEPLNGPVRVGDEVRQEAFGFAVTAVVARMDGRGDPLTAEGAIIGDLRHGTWYVRRPIQELPEADGAVIVPADGCQYIETRTGKKSRRLTWDAECLVWYDARGTHLHGDITPGTWKVDDQ